MEKLFLIRRGRFDIHGPLKKNEIKLFFSKEDMNLNWEICGHLGSWVSLKSEQELKTQYYDIWKEFHGSSFSLRSLFQRKK